MKNTKLISLLKTFTMEEMKNFGKFIDSPYFTSGRNFKPLYSILKKNHPEFRNQFLTEEYIYKKLNPKEKYDPKRSSVYLRVLYSEMTKLAKKFLVYEMFNSGKADFHIALIGSKALEKKNLFSEALKMLTENSIKLDAKEKNVEYYFQRIYIDQLISHNLVRTSNELKAVEHEKNTLRNTFAFLFPVLSGFIHNGRTRKYNFNIEFHGFELVKSLINGFDPVLFQKECTDDEFETKNKVLFNYYILKSRIDENDIDSMLMAVKVYKNMFDNLPGIFRFNYYLNLYNRFEGRRPFDKIYSVMAHELFEFISKKGFAESLWSKHHPDRFFCSVLLFKAAVLQPEEIKNFINKHINHLPEEIRNDLKNFSMSVFFFKKREYSKSLECISNNDSLDIFFKLNKYKIRVCSLYELNLVEDTLYALSAFEQFLRRKKDLGLYIRTENMKFVKAMRDLILFDPGNNMEIKLNALKEVNRNTIFGDWLIDKVNERTSFNQ